MTKPKLQVVTTTTALAPARPGPKFKIPLLTEMTPAAQRAYIYEAHDAVLAHQLTLPDWSPQDVGMTVEEGLRVMLQNAVNPPTRHDHEVHRVKEALRYLGIELTPSRTRKLAELPSAADDSVSDEEYRERYIAALHTVPNAVTGPRAIVGESASPLGYITRGLSGRYKGPKAAQKPLLQYYDLFHSLGFPLYSKSYRHLIDFNEVLANYKPWLAEAERGKHALKLKRATVRQLEEEAPEIVRLRAHNLILNTRVRHHGQTTIREALVLARTEVDTMERHAWWFSLREAGIELQPDGAACAGVVVHPANLINRNRLELSPYKKLLGSTIEGALEVRFELVV